MSRATPQCSLHIHFTLGFRSSLFHVHPHKYIYFFYNNNTFHPYSHSICLVPVCRNEIPVNSSSGFLKSLIIVFVTFALLCAFLDSCVCTWLNILDLVKTRRTCRYWLFNRVVGTMDYMNGTPIAQTLGFSNLLIHVTQ